MKKHLLIYSFHYLSAVLLATVLIMGMIQSPQ